VEAGAEPLPCYLYLKNRTFLNLHLIQRGLAAVDTEGDYKYKDRFLKKGGKRTDRTKEA
jgi:site-specific DNA-methyltransferase (adenine-specific)